MAKQTKYIFVVGGVMSGVGKGVTTSSIGKILQSRGLNVTAFKIDPYINVDAGTMNPTEHGEVFVLKDGYETDQDMGNYERFLNIELDRGNYMTTGSVYRTVIERERNLEYNGKCVEVVPHIPLEVISRIKQAAHKSAADVAIIEIGGTVGEYQNILFLEAVRMMKIESPEDVITVIVSYIPTPSTVGEMKTKPTQYAVRALNSTGIQPDIIVARAERPLDEKRKEKIAVFCSVRKEDVISAPDVESIYDVPLNFEKDHLSDILLKKLSLKAKKQNGTLKEWEKAVKRIHSATHKVHIGIVGKYFKTGDFVLSDAYISVIEALKHAGCAVGVKVVLDWIDSTDFEKDKKKLLRLKKYDGILIPGGFGSRGVEGKIRAVRFCRENNIPYFGLCYGMQLAVIEYARNVLGLTEALTTEIDQKTVHPVVDIMPEQKENLRQKNYGATMRLGHYEAKILPNTIARIAYGKDSVLERHRHRYEVNPAYVKDLEKAGLVFSATSPNGVLMEIAELPQAKHPFFLGTQFHPEFQSSLLHPHPLFVAFVKAASERKNRIES
ncbi:MAG: CTP synthase [Candidatus Moranbacteria bacterium RIFCSPLOWO2_02_FULL_48_19]|nr:MAG: CTP synthase [Candidatus Moranbacteria bacterium RIFCSPLOWO2_02_FULL_48_19]OGI30063.1 MAG: CTP synthase [Candidatus Moranbacteria bacterium RIFCSPLOWO2_12_FULL_48_12]